MSKLVKTWRVFLFGMCCILVSLYLKRILPCIWKKLPVAGSAGEGAEQLHMGNNRRRS